MRMIKSLRSMFNPYRRRPSAFATAVPFVSSWRRRGECEETAVGFTKALGVVAAAMIAMGFIVGWQLPSGSKPGDEAGARQQEPQNPRKIASTANGIPELSMKPTQRQPVTNYATRWPETTAKR
jgi:hypothetical protein